MTNQISRVEASLYSLFVGDALSMPVHWFYRVSDIYRTFPPLGITKMEAAPAEHPSSIMSLHSTQAGGRRAAAAEKLFNSRVGSHTHDVAGEIIGDVILKGKREFWGGSSTHYHHGMAAGDNTLNACCARLMLRHLVSHGGYHKNHWLDEYVAFMTADPAQHPDTYAESYHRGFFSNLRDGKPIDQCGALTHDTASMGALVTVGPLALSLFQTHELEQAIEICQQHVRLTHPDAGLLSVVAEYVFLTYTLLAGIEEQVENGDGHSLIHQAFVNASKVVPGAQLAKHMQKRASDAEIVGGTYSTACYITDSWPSVCYLCAKYHRTPGKALLVNTNLGGENAHRGSVLGSLVGLVRGEFDVALFTQLVHQEAIMQEVEGFIKCFYGDAH